ncbi:hypothetical protein Acsp04_50580 [Actinomadura sp. NBRC 104425]|uniref:peptidoglycan recognition protein family protein n=1 Tax=Actinomadura sp. NBRC 104425 TaxID=3032204 RepID=UPI0024A53F08|nr:peptidoglycan recognition family protein [Actinomadura sp. NBRC 104425]GLZ14823.1 hypothetical protein Acsp04_50580 [Actinomadura sp. NBRC 104425]
MRRTVAGVLSIGLFDALLLETLPAVAAAESQRLPADGHDDRRLALSALRPRIYTRSEWGARPPRERARILRRPPRHIVVHHTATPNYPDESLQHAYWLSRWIQHHHMRVRGWADTGQQLTISRGGHVMEGRNRSLSAIRRGHLVVGAQVRGYNRTTIGIENEGTYMEDEVPRRLWVSLERVCAWLCAQYELDPFRAIVGHRDFADTDCPGDVLYAMLPDLRRGVVDRLERSIGRARPKKRRVRKRADARAARPDIDPAPSTSPTPRPPAPETPSPSTSRPEATSTAPEPAVAEPSSPPEAPGDVSSLLDLFE